MDKKELAVWAAGAGVTTAVIAVTLTGSVFTGLVSAAAFGSYVAFVSAVEWVMKTASKK
jgi:hypothetical protein